MDPKLVELIINLLTTNLLVLSRLSNGQEITEDELELPLLSDKLAKIKQEMGL